MTATVSGLSVPSADLCHVQWRSLAWVLENGPINEKNAMEYFSHSPFYDRRSTNQVLRMQSMFSGQPPLQPEAEKEALKKLVGIEYSLVLSKPEADREGGLFVVEKRDRKSFDESYPIASYYILKTCIYQSPSFHATLSCRLLTSLSSLSDLLTLARSHKPLYDTRQGYNWKIKMQDDAPEGESTPPDQGTLNSTNGVNPVLKTAGSTIQSKEEAPEAASHSMVIDGHPTPETNGSGPTLNPNLAGVRNMLLERAFQATTAIFALPKLTPGASTLPAPTPPEFPNSSGFQGESVNGLGDLAGLTAAPARVIPQATPNASSASLTHSSLNPDSAIGKTASKGAPSGKRKLKRAA